MKLDRTLGARLSPRQTHAYGALKRGVKVLSTRVVDRRTRIGKALDAWRTELISDLGGRDELSAAKVVLIDAAVKTKLILDSIEVWILEQKSLVSGRNRGVLPVVLHRNQLVGTLKGLLEALGLERRTRDLPSLEVIAREYAEGNGGHERNEVNERSPEAKP